MNRTWFSHSMPQWLWSLTKFAIGIIYCSRSMHLQSMRLITQSFDDITNGNQLKINVTETLTFELATPISIEVINCPRPMQMWIIKPIGQIVDKLLIGNDFHAYCDSDLWTSDPNFKRGHLDECPRPMHIGSIKPIGEAVHNLLLGNELVYRQTSSNTIYLRFFEGGHHKISGVIIHNYKYVVLLSKHGTHLNKCKQTL